MRRLAIGLLVFVAALGGGCGGEPSRGATSAAADERKARAAAERFLDGYVDGDGRVGRRDEGDDTVGEGQAYAMLLTVAIGRRSGFERVWRWTRAHIQRDDGLLAHRWEHGSVTDPEAATDADVDAAHALEVAARRFRRPLLRREARRIARAIVEHETARDDRGRRILVAGPWAKQRRVVNVSYLAPQAFARLATLGRRTTWRRLRRDAPRLVDRLRHGGLPADWAISGPGGALTPVASAGGEGAGGRYGFDAVRVPIRLGAACDRSSRRTAAKLLPLLQGDGADGLPRGLDGAVAAGAVRHAVALVGVAGAAFAAREHELVRRLLDDAEQLEREHPTYYGAAWVALGRVLLTTELLGRC